MTQNNLSDKGSLEAVLVSDSPCVRLLGYTFLREYDMSRLYFVIGGTSSEAAKLDQIVLVILPEANRRAVVPTYSGQLHKGLNVLLRLGKTENIVTENLLPYFKSLDEATIAGKRAEQDSLRSQIDAVKQSVVTRVAPFLKYLSAKRAIDRKLYSMLEKMRQKGTLSNKDLVPLIDSVYVTLRRESGATSTHKEKIRSYLENGSCDIPTLQLLARVVNPVFDVHLRHDSLAREVQQFQNQNQPQGDVTLQKDLIALKKHFGADASKMFRLDDALIEEIKGLFGSELSFLGKVLKSYTERNKPAACT